MSVQNQDLFVHEMTHVYQHHHGVSVLARDAVLQLIATSVVGKYITHIFNEVKCRSSHVIARRIGYQSPHMNQGQ